MKQLSFKQAWKDAEAVPGLVTEEEMKLLWDAINSDGARVRLAVELGCLFGRSTTMILNALPETAKFYSVDNFAIQESDTRSYFLKNIIEKYLGRVTLIDAPSHTAAGQDHHGKWKEGIDFIFIDADHQDHSILQDCQDWLPKVNPGGIVAFHDYFNDQFPSVARRAEEFTAGWNCVGQAGSLMIKRKPL